MTPEQIEQIAKGLTKAQRAALDWMRKHGGDCAVARCKDGGRIYLAQGESGPFLPQTARALIRAGLAEYVDCERTGRKAIRFRLMEQYNEQD